MKRRICKAVAQHQRLIRLGTGAASVQADAVDLKER